MSAVLLIVLACDHRKKNEGQANDMIGAAAKLFWRAARADAFTFVRDNGKKMLRNADPDEYIAIGTAALDNMAKLREASELCSTLIDLLREERANEQG
jgi:hypothetical protein